MADRPSSLAGEAGCALQRALTPDQVAFDVPLSGLGRWRIGGPADVVVTPRDRGALAATLRIVHETGVPYLVIGDGSNLLFDDAGFRGVVIRVARNFAGVERLSATRIIAGAGIWTPQLVRWTITNGLAGIVHAIGIPGTFGGLCVMNGGSQRKGIGDHLAAVTAMTPDGGTVVLERETLGLGYRRSRFQGEPLILLDATLELEPGDPRRLRREAIEIMASRRAKFPRIRANCGSVFVSDPKLYAMIGPPGQAIEQVGLKGLAIGDAQISPDHANFIVNRGRARSADVLALIRLARERVRDASGIAMDAEVRHVSPSGAIVAAHAVA